MNWADYAIIAMLALSVLMGLWRGLVAEVLALAVWGAAFWVAWWLGPRVATAFRGTIDEPSIRIIVGYALCFVAILILGALLKFVLAKLVQGTGLSGSDRLLGMLFGLARGVLLVTLLVFLLEFTPFSRDSWWHRSRLLPTFISAADWLGQQLPQGIQQYLHPSRPVMPHIDVSGYQALAPHVPIVPGQDPAAPTSAVSAAGRDAIGVALPAHSRDN